MSVTGGTICNLSSLGYRAPMQDNAVYGATKAFITSFTLGLAAELRATPAHAMVVHPGFVATGVHERSGFDASWVPAGMWLSPEQVAHTTLRDAANGRVRSVPGGAYVVIDRVADVLPRVYHG
jgi:short-subunit dehydrogenase